MIIKIKKSASADTRSATEPVTKETLLRSSEQHIDDVQQALSWMCALLMGIAMRHDWTKLDGLNQFHEDFKAIQEKRMADFKKLPWYIRHVTTERHHMLDRCPANVNLFDVLEQIADIVMAGMARTGKVYDEQMPPEILSRAYANTIELLKSCTEVDGTKAGIRAAVEKEMKK